MADDLHVASKCQVSSDALIIGRGIEVGQVFNFGLKYSKAMEASVMSGSKDKIYPNMGSYGIGVSRVVAASIEANHDERGIIWPKALSPFEVILINVKSDDEKLNSLNNNIYKQLLDAKIEVLYDDTKNSLGQKLAIADLIGVTWQIIVGNKALNSAMVEIKNRQTNEKFEIATDQIINFIKNN
jgi:prolyl-tRNA synthetase